MCPPSSLLKKYFLYVVSLENLFSGIVTALYQNFLIALCIHHHRITEIRSNRHHIVVIGIHVVDLRLCILQNRLHHRDTLGGKHPCILKMDIVW